MRILLLEPDAVTDADGAAYHRLFVDALAADRPGDPPPDVAEVTGRLRVRRDDQRTLRWVARDGDAMLGHLVLMLPQLDNQHVTMVHAVVHPAHRRRGIATTLLRTALPAAAGRRSLLVEAHDGSAGEACCRAYGLRPVGSERLSLLRLADVDWADVSAAAAAEHPGYRLERWGERCPDELLDRYATAKTAMNDAPLDDIDLAGRVYTGDVIRDDEAGYRESRLDQRVVIAVHEATGVVAGLTEVLVASPPWSFQNDTAVVPAHRGRGLGLWVKADMLCRLHAERPEVAELLTGNAASNAHMLRINDRLGYRPYQALTEWQADLAELAARLG